ncbi:hypothetical protein Alches_22190 [Alicyclobacillus hesperidum subsp. aegles]|uniref:phage tail assembly chaperone n=1 Tax=Alicyclobacillus hesperidum TaxID=89784 RepID=UPI00222A1F47|nr:hypothetical protein [Alicyclobacillus hesperidum]GLG02178.1 hypothetical protein Alches_22190 [Alicyclobacillus hesperidum subsp. aegles]
MSERFKTVTIKGREYQISKWPAREGVYIVTKLSGLLAPMFAPLLQGVDAKKLLNAKNPSDLDLHGIDIASMFKPLASIPEADFMYLQDKCLAVVKVKLPAGYINVVNDNGSVAIEDLEEDGMLVLTLMVHAIMHNLAGFFSGSPLMGLFGDTQATRSAT